MVLKATSRFTYHRDDSSVYCVVGPYSGSASEGGVSQFHIQIYRTFPFISYYDLFLLALSHTVSTFSITTSWDFTPLVSLEPCVGLCYFQEHRIVILGFPPGLFPPVSTGVSTLVSGIGFDFHLSPCMSHHEPFSIVCSCSSALFPACTSSQQPQWSWWVCHCLHSPSEVPRLQTQLSVVHTSRASFVYRRRCFCCPCL